MEAKNQRGRLTLTNKETGEERVYTTSFKRLFAAVNFLEEPLQELFGAQVSYTYSPATGSLRPLAATAATEKWEARVVCEDLYRMEEALTEREEAYRAAEDEAEEIDPAALFAEGSDGEEERWIG